MLVVGPHPQFAVTHVDRIFDTLMARLHQDRRRGRIGGGHQPHFARFVVAGRDHQPVFLRGEAGADREALVFLLVERDVAVRRLADHVELGLQCAPFLGRGAVNQRGIARDPDKVAAQVGDDVGEQLARLQILDPRGETLRPVGVGREGEIALVLADRGGAKAEVFLALCQHVFVNQQFGFAARDGFTPMLAVLRAFLELAPVEVVAVFLRNRGVVLLDTATHFREQRVCQRGLACHFRFEIGVLRLDVIEHVLVVHHRIGLVVEPVIRVFDGDPVHGVGVRALLRDRRLDV